MQKSLLIAAAAIALIAATPVSAFAQVVSARYVGTANHHARVLAHYRRTPPVVTVRPGDYITNFSSSEHVAVNHPPKNR